MVADTGVVDRSSISLDPRLSPTTLRRLSFTMTTRPTFMRMRRGTSTMSGIWSKVISSRTTLLMTPPSPPMAAQTSSTKAR